MVYFKKKQMKRFVMVEEKNKNNMYATGIVDLKFLQEEGEEAEKRAVETAAKIDKTMQAQKSSEK